MFSWVNLLGLSLAIVSVCLILIYVQNELNFDRYNKNADRIYRVYATFSQEGKSQDWVQTATPLAAFLKDKLPEIENSVRVAKVPKGLIKYGENNFYEENIVLADASIFDVFTFPLLVGNPQTILENPNSVILSETIAKKYFGNDNPIGKTINYGQKIDLTVSGIMKDVPENTHLPCEMIVSMPTSSAFFGDNFLTNKMNTSVFTYLLTHKGTEKNQFENDFSEVSTDYYGSADMGITFHVQLLTSIHLYSNKGGEYQPNGDIRTVYIFSAIAILILIIACINYINLSFSLNKKRSTELGVRKIMGAGVVQLIRLSLSNAFVITTISVLLSSLVVLLLLPSFTHFTGSEIRLSNLNYKFYLKLILTFSFVVLVTGFSSGWLAASIKPTNTLKKSGIRNIGIHGIMVLFQFSVSIILIASTFLVSRQMNLLKNKNLGFSKEQLLVIPINSQNLQSRIESLKQDLLTNPNILSASATSDLPGKLLWVSSINYEGQSEQSDETMTYLEIDKDFAKTYGVQMKEGYLPGDLKNPYSGVQYLLNESAVKKLGWEQPIGKMFGGGYQKEGHVTGVVQDFNFKSLHENIEPLFLYINEGKSNYLTLKLDTRDVTKTISSIGQQWNKFVQDTPFEYFFYDDFYNQLYKKESKFSQIIFIFSCMSILIACLGIFALATFLSETRIKEIGIRKVNGAKISEILTMLNKDFVKWVVIAFVIATPIAYYVMNKWLESFAYKTELGWWIFALAGLLALGIALLTVSWQSWRAATKNPVEALRYE